MKTTEGCRKCYFYQGDSIDGVCMWFVLYKKEDKARSIPKERLIKGCKFFITKKVSHLIKVFDGEIIYEESLFGNRPRR
jgi:hypothetical protein